MHVPCHRLHSLHNLRISINVSRCSRLDCWLICCALHGHLQVYPVKLTQQAICVDVSSSTKVATRSDRGGAGTSLENNNVFTVQVRMARMYRCSTCLCSGAARPSTSRTNPAQRRRTCPDVCF